MILTNTTKREVLSDLQQNIITPCHTIHDEVLCVVSETLLDCIAYKLAYIASDLQTPAHNTKHPRIRFVVDCEYNKDNKSWNTNQSINAYEMPKSHAEMQAKNAMLASTQSQSANNTTQSKQSNINNELFMFVEQGQFLHTQDNTICVKEDCNTCQHAHTCQPKRRLCSVDLTPAVRDLISASNDTSNYDLNAKDLQSQVTQNKQYIGKHLPRNTKRVFKVVKNANEIPSEHLAFNPNDTHTYCLQQLCSECEYNNLCDREFIIKRDSDIVLSLDFRSQEPRLFTIATQSTNNNETQWEHIFCNDTIKALGKPYQTLELLFTMQGIDTQSAHFINFVDTQFFKDKTLLYQLQTACNLCYQEQSEDNLFKLQSVINAIMQSYKTYLQGRDNV